MYLKKYTGINPRNKFELKDYLESLDLKDFKTLENRSDEIVNNVERVMKPYIETTGADLLRDYYLPAIERIRESYKEQDFKDKFPRALDFLVGSIEWE